MYLKKPPKAFIFDANIKPKTHLMESNEEKNVSFILTKDWKEQTITHHLIRHLTRVGTQ